MNEIVEKNASPNELYADFPGPKFTREDLKILASGKISTVFGDWFKPLDQYERVIRMPEPPLLLADRVLGIRGEPGVIGKGSLWTETDVMEDAWYLHQGRMVTGIALESGQADLLLCSWQGLDFYNRNERIYRLLGCELTCFRELPKPGETLHFDIHINGHAKQGDIRLFFFQYDCRIQGELLFQLRNGQAGFFTDEELVNSGGLLWEATTEKIDMSAQLDPPLVQCHKTAFTQLELTQFSKGQVVECFGTGFEATLNHRQTPHIPGGKLLFLNEITHFDTKGGPWQRGYMRAVQNVDPDDWFFKCHFKNDPCMPGSLMLEAGLHVMYCYLTGLGYTLNKDGWRFEPVLNHKSKLKCRGQIHPGSKQAVYEIFVTSVIAAPIPMLFAFLVGTVDGLKSLYINIGVRLVPEGNHRESLLMINDVLTQDVKSFSDQIQPESHCREPLPMIEEVLTQEVKSFSDQIQPESHCREPLPMIHETLNQGVKFSPDLIQKVESDLFMDLSKYPLTYFAGKIRLPSPPLLMLDQVTEFWPNKGAYNKGQLVAKIKFHPEMLQSESPGLEALRQLMQFYVIHQKLHIGMEYPHYQAKTEEEIVSEQSSINVNQEYGSSYIILDITHKGHDGVSVYVLAQGSLWINDTLAYTIKNLAARVTNSQPVNVRNYPAHSRKWLSL